MIQDPVRAAPHGTEELGPALGYPAGNEAAIVGAVVFLVYLLLHRGPPLAAGVMADDGVYIALGRAIAGGHGYRAVYLAGSPLEAKYPPGLPLLLAALWTALGELPRLLRAVAVLDAVAIAAASGLLWWVARHRLGIPAAVSAVFVLGPLFLDACLQHFGLAASEPWFMLGWAALIAISGGSRLGGESEDAYRTAVTAGLCTAAAALFRSQAVVFVPAVALALVFRRASWRAAGLYLLAACVPLAAWTAAHAHMLSGSAASTALYERSYADFFAARTGAAGLGAMPGVALGNAITYWRILAFELGGPPRADILGAGLMIVASVVGTRLLLKRDPTAALTLGATGLLALVWPDPFQRMLLMTLPFMGLAAAFAVSEGTKRAGARVRAGVTSVLVVSAAAVGFWQVRNHRESMREFRLGEAPRFLTTAYEFAWIDRFIRSGSEWLEANTPPDAVVASDWPAGLYLYGGRCGVIGRPDWRSAPGAALADLILAQGPDVVVSGPVGGPRERDVRVVTAACPGVLIPTNRSDLGDPPAFFRVAADTACLRAAFGTDSLHDPPRRP